ncbi:MAG: hypothetical protein DWQ31_10220 [Planctomycetota bacterium]|nr:MAG: hypothetical protein DWQ31_10220 [Planctomycetota bacterium]REJ96518.1 MAG: hypothetical protein DWQ35_04015 [Planctomycetota bacterium]
MAHRPPSGPKSLLILFLLSAAFAVLSPSGFAEEDTPDAPDAAGTGSESESEETTPPQPGLLDPRAMRDKYDEVKNAWDALNTGDRDTALDVLKTAAEAHSELPPGEVILALIYGMQRNQVFLQAYQQALEQAVEAHPDDPDAYLIMAGRAISARRITESRLLLDTAKPLIDAFTKNEDRKKSMLIRYYKGRALLDEYAERWEAAAANWERRLAIDEKAATDRYLYARALFHVGTKAARKKALQQVTQAHAENEQLNLPYIAIAQFFEEKKNEEKAKEWYVEAEKEYADNPRMHQSLAQWNWKQGDAAEARRHAEAAVAIDPENVAVKFLLGLLLQHDEEFKLAEKTFVECQMKEPEAAAIKNHLALVRFDLGDATRASMAQRMATENYKKNPRDPLTIATLGYILFKSGDDRSRKQGSQLLGMVANSPLPDIQFFLASALVDSGQADEAKKRLEQILERKELFAFRRQAEALLSSLE